MAKNKNNKNQNSPKNESSKAQTQTQTVPKTNSVPTTERTKLSWKFFYEQASSFLFESVEVKGQSQAWWDYMRFYNGMAICFPEMFSDLVIFKRNTIPKTGASTDSWNVIDNTEENRKAYLLKAYPTEHKEDESVVEIGVGIADDPTLGIDTPPDDFNQSQVALPGVAQSPSAGKQYPPIEPIQSPSQVTIDQLTKDGVSTSA